MLLNHLSAVAIVLMGITVYGQEQAATKDKKPSEKNHEVSERYQRAALILDSMVDEIRDVNSLDVRIAMTEEVVKMLARQKPEKCRRMLDALFDELLQAKKAETPETGRQLSSNTRRVIGMAAAFDQKLAQSYIDRFSAEGENRQGVSQAIRPSEQNSYLLMTLATQIIEKDPSVAVSVAERTLKTAVTGDTLIFLGKLRKKAPALANRFFIDALNNIKLRQGRDVNELLLLYSYAFASTRVPRVVSQRLVLVQLQEYVALASDLTLDAALARQYLQISAEILLEPSRYIPDNLASLNAGVTGDFYLIRLIAPYANVHTPSLTERLLRQQHLISAYLNPDQASQLETNAGRFNGVRKSQAGGSENNYESVERLSTAAADTTDARQRDQYLYRAAVAAVKEKKYEIALETASKISPDYRNLAREFITFSIAERAVAEGDLEKAEQLARRDNDVVRRAYALTLIAKSLIEEKNRDTVRANAMLDEIGQLADKPETGDNEKLSILLELAGVYASFDHVRAFETLREIVKRANKLERWTGDNRIVRLIEIGGFGFAYELFDSNVSLSQLVGRLAAENFDEAMISVQSLKNGVPRLRSMIALCNLALAEKAAR